LKSVAVMAALVEPTLVAGNVMLVGVSVRVSLG